MCISVKRLFLVLVVSLAVGLCASARGPLAHAAEPSAVRPWIELDLEAIASHSTNPPRASRALAHLSSAMYLAALAGREARDDAVAGAASTVLVHFYPDEAGRIDALADRLANVGSPAFARGRLVGRLLVTRAKLDHSDAVWTGSAPV